MKAHKVTLLVLSVNDELSAEEIKSEIENNRYPNDCISVEVHDIESAEIGEWDDDHPLNQTDASNAEWERLFPSLTRSAICSARLRFGRKTR